MTRSTANTNLVPGQDTVLALPRHATSTSLALPDDLPFDRWVEIGTALNRADRALRWWVGDWSVHGEKRYGETYTAAIEGTGLDYKSVANAASVSRAIESSRRRENLTWSHHEVVAALEPGEQDGWLDRAESENWTRSQLRAAIREERLAKEREANPFPEGTYRVIYADPPWKYNDERQQTTGAAVDHYPVLSVEEICELHDAKGRTVKDLSQPNAVVFLWATAPMLREAMQVMEAWGFAYKAQYVWLKQRGYYGHYNDVRHELLLIGVRGSCVPDCDSLHPSDVAIERAKHSAKPLAFYEIVEAMYPGGPYVELFARNTRPGWDSWGNEVPVTETA